VPASGHLAPPVAGGGTLLPVSPPLGGEFSSRNQYVLPAPPPLSDLLLAAAGSPLLSHRMCCSDPDSTASALGCCCQLARPRRTDLQVAGIHSLLETEGEVQISIHSLCQISTLICKSCCCGATNLSRGGSGTCSLLCHTYLQPRRAEGGDFVQALDVFQPNIPMEEKIGCRFLLSYYFILKV